MAQNLLTPSNARYNLDLVVTLILNVRHSCDEGDRWELHDGELVWDLETSSKCDDYSTV